MIDGLITVLPQLTAAISARRGESNDVLSHIRPKTYISRMFNPYEVLNKNLETLKFENEVKYPIALSKHLSNIKGIECLENNWDNYGAIAPNIFIISQVKKFLTLLPNQFLEALETEYVFPNPNGTISVEWRNHNNAVSIEFGAETANYFVCLNSEYNGDENIKNIEEHIPRALISSIAKVI